jgi:hypothetical protein
LAVVGRQRRIPDDGQLSSPDNCNCFTVRARPDNHGWLSECLRIRQGWINGGKLTATCSIDNDSSCFALESLLKGRSFFLPEATVADVVEAVIGTALEEVVVEEVLQLAAEVEHS